MQQGMDEQLYFYVGQQIDRASTVPLPAQLSASLRKLIDADVLKQDELLPSTRELSYRLNLSRSTICKCYSRLKSEGYLRNSPGKGVLARKAAQNNLTKSDETRWEIGSVADFSPDSYPHPTEKKSETQMIDLTQPLPILSTFSTREWQRLCLRQSRSSASSLLEIPDDRFGSPRLRQAIAAILLRLRGIKTRPANILITSNPMHELLAMGLLRNGHRQTVGIEDLSPCGAAIQNLFENVISLPVDKDGVIASREALARLDTLIVTPNHNFPFTSILAIHRRTLLLSWSSRPGRVLIELDGDAMLNYGTPSLPSLHTMSGGNVLHAGTFDHLLGAGLGLSYIIIPEELLEKVSQVGSMPGLAPSLFIQNLIASFIESGGFESHLRDTARTLSLWREIFSTMLYRRLGENASCTGTASGLFISLVLKKNVSIKPSTEKKLLTQTLVSELEQRGVIVKPLRENDMEAELLICFGHLSRSQLEHSVNAICECLQSIYDVKGPLPLAPYSGIACGDTQTAAIQNR